MSLGVYLFRGGAITIGTVYLIIHYLQMLYVPLNKISGQVEDLQRAKVSIERVKALIEIRPKIEVGSELVLPTRTLSIQFKDVSFGYNEEKRVLKDISFSLSAGKVLGLLGRTGSGQTTPSRLLFRL